MARVLALVLVLVMWCMGAPAAQADVAGLTPCRESAAFQQRLSDEVATQEARLPLYAAGSPQVAAVERRIAQSQARFDRYADQGLLCGEDGLPHLITDGRWSHAAEFTLPGLLFLYIAGWIGWVGRAYLIVVRSDKDPAEKEIIIDVPLAIRCMLSGFSWPLLAFRELTTGQLTVNDNEISVSPR
ncbi:photosystem I subunit III [Gloeomargarita lithophora Alchichica-D10]|uniref:Photosystem I reaction center subunit III n=1 Tax=Gloeomargarita lithophora Alchichica-D10 TaxID=1188229 RepID=A0A1J0AEQ7_9CYAN|nr:Photosystem I reaction center subunit III [Gloeomargarita lithophora]APB34426.1 photosystem I subunit III [Gloeomargarita lithophora Alchichica-D10]